MNRKKILFLEQYSKISGGQKVLLSLAGELKGYYDLCVVVPEKGDLTTELENLNIEYAVFPIGYYSIGKKTFFDIFNYLLRLPFLVRKLTTLLKEKDIDLVYANGARTFIWGSIACKKTRVPMVWYIHSIFDKGLIKKLCVLFGKNDIVKNIIAVSQSVKKPLALVGEKIKVIYNGIDTGLYFPATSKNGPFRKELKIGNTPLIGMVCFLMEWKGIDDLLMAGKEIIRVHPNVKFAIIGDVLYDTKGQKYKKYLISMVKKLGLNDNVIFTGYRKDIPAVMKELDIFVLASKKPDPCPTSLLQAMASGAASIATDFGGPAELIDNGKDGLLYEPGNHMELAEKISSLLDDPEKRAELSHNARKKIERDFNRIDYLNKIKKIIDDSFRNIYINGGYAKYNPSWHIEDSPWKARKIINVIPEAVLGKLNSKLKIVDAGCGTGEILKLVSRRFRDNGLSVSCDGYDISPSAIESAKKNFPEANFYCRGFDKGRYKTSGQNIDIALLIDILEHIEDPQRLLREVSEVSAYAVCHMPLEDNLEVKIRRLKKRFKKSVGHINYYNKKSAVELIEKNGFSIEDMTFTCLDYDADYAMKSLPRRLIAQPLRRIFFKDHPGFTAAVLGNCSLMFFLRSLKKNL